ncbi:hypothetical protein MED222_05420 [Vibrio sp. MED222]|nr:hypothetical protein MED222_05420 [Vibrio sp. MED222]
MMYSLIYGYIISLVYQVSERKALREAA